MNDNYDNEGNQRVRLLQWSYNNYDNNGKTDITKNRMKNRESIKLNLWRNTNRKKK